MENNPIPDSIRKSIELSEKLKDSIAPIVEQQEKLQWIVDATAIPEVVVPSPALEAFKGIQDQGLAQIMKENMPAYQGIAESVTVAKSLIETSPTIETIQNSGLLQTVGELAMKSAIPSYQFESPVLAAFEKLSNNVVTNLAAGLTALVTSPVMQEIHAISSNLGKWLQTVDFSPLIDILENIKDSGFDYDYKEVNEVFLKAMFDARWFPYAGWIADFRIVDEMLEILDTSRVSKNRIKRIDKLIFSYYDKEEINNFKRGWRQKNLPSYMIRILVQSVQAYHRREYALTVSALSTLWEGIIQEKVKDDTYRISKRTRENLTKLIEENEFDKIFSSFCEEFIFYDCRKAEEVKPDVPGRHGIAHCWYDTYPNRKTALNAILFTDFLLGLKPLEAESSLE